ncbi:hypothetical protein N7509_009170 [Penicillium cosmopolitanum]|uniref:Mid2 domain-containing protein n=1 Tax=Penicillium cosmopolitanum TaxID=1131564 RepID=A0A9X0B3C5_9EURO|nr:uncharacterized protein N7509_009170 [Penicillium cosmopolitanum]KAJ5386629.1 hypothetical protein N7509_009170 [Penicillium cosmopolitanum]
MAHHGHWRDSRTSRLLRAKRRLEVLEEAAKDDNVSPSILISGGEIENEPLASPEDIILPGTPPYPEDTNLMKRQEADQTQSVVVETVLQVVDTNSHTLWQSAGVDFPLTLSDPAFGTVTLSAGETAFASEAALLVTSPTALPIAQQTNVTTPTSEAVSHTSKPTAAVSSPKISSAISSTPTSSIPLVSPSSNSTSSPTTSSQIASIYSTSSAISSTTSSSSSSASSTSSTWYGGYGQTVGGTSSGSSPTSTSSESSSGSDTASDTTTPKIVGGVVGSVAGVALLLLLILFLFRRRSLQQKGTQALPSSSDSGAREVAERRTSKDPLFGASYLAPAFVKRWRQSTMSTKTESTVSSTPSERGFQKISGRKIAPVLTHGGDGFGGALSHRPVSLVSGGPLSSPSHAPPTATPFGMPLDTNVTREAGEENVTPTRPRQANIPVSNSVNFSSPTTVTPSHPIPQPQSAIPVAPRKDPLGRSLPSFDGSRDSRGSRFTESLDL